MSEENGEVARRFGDAFNRRDLPALLRCCTPDVELDFSSVLIGTPTYRGREGIERWFQDTVAAWEELQADVDVVTEAGNDAVFATRGYGRGKTTGAPFAADVAVLARFRQGKVWHAEWFTSK